MTKLLFCVALLSACMVLIAAPLDIALHTDGALRPLFMWGLIVTTASSCLAVVIEICKA